MRKATFNLLHITLAFGSQVFSFRAVLHDQAHNRIEAPSLEWSFVMKTHSWHQTNCTPERRRSQTFAPFPACGLSACKYLFTSSSFLFHFFFFSRLNLLNAVDNISLASQEVGKCNRRHLHLANCMCLLQWLHWHLLFHKLVLDCIVASVGLLVVVAMFCTVSYFLVWHC